MKRFRPDITEMDSEHAKAGREESRVLGVVIRNSGKLSVLMVELSLTGNCISQSTNHCQRFRKAGDSKRF